MLLHLQCRTLEQKANRQNHNNTRAHNRRRFDPWVRGWAHAYRAMPKTVQLVLRQEGSCRRVSIPNSAVHDRMEICFWFGVSFVQLRQAPMERVHLCPGGKVSYSTFFSPSLSVPYLSFCLSFYVFTTYHIIGERRKKKRNEKTIRINESVALRNGFTAPSHAFANHSSRTSNY